MRYTLEELEDLPVLCQGQADDLKIDTGEVRVWLCRCDVSDGMPYNNAVTIERLSTKGRWEEVSMHEARPRGVYYFVE